MFRKMVPLIQLILENTGEQPISKVISELKQLKQDGILLIIAPFIPSPLIDRASKFGTEHWVESYNEEKVFVYFMRGKE